MNAKKEILELLNGETILAISLGEKGSGSWEDAEKKKTQFFFGVFFGEEGVERVLGILDFNFDEGYGGENGYALYVWTKTRIIVKDHYDGAEVYLTIPRNPTDKVMPESIGGG